MSFARVCAMRFVVMATLIAESHSVCIAGPIALGAGPAAAAGGAAAAGTAATAGSAAAAGTAAAGTAAGGAVAGTAAAAAAAGSAAASPAALGAGTAGTAAAANAVGAMFANPLWTLGQLASLGLGLVVVGAEAEASAVTWDCWKPILHEKSTAPSRGRLLQDILNDPAISDYSVGNHSVVVRNRWNESWRIDPVVLPWGQMAAHASQIMPSPFNLSTRSIGGIGGNTVFQ
eukprot:TRINITY_DN5467_c1_g1_i4.p1 TRINITY_DN5467_c1_g1~~TRINITY_DN5467_c1_g1_i4.p1  ORF type:complete len:231 (-),score=40.45 TRINITY_DN5467_c1_g1_i4:311-1003(-)